MPQDQLPHDADLLSRLMWPKIEHEEDGYMLGRTRHRAQRLAIEEEIAEHLANILLARYPERLAERYGLDVNGLDGYGALEGIAKDAAVCSKDGAENWT